MGSSPPYITDAGAQSTGAQLKLQPRGATPPVNAYITASQVIQVTIWNAAAGITVFVNAMMLMPDGTVSPNGWQFQPGSTRAKQSFTQPLTEGFLLSLSVSGAVTGSGNRTFVAVKLFSAAGTGSILTQTLNQGYISQTKCLVWPPGTQEDSAGGAGAIVSLTGTTPAAGAEISEVVPTNAIWQLKAFTFTLTTAVAVANRIPHLIVDDGTNVLLAAPALSILGAATLGRYVTGDDALSTTATDGVQWLQSISDLRLMPGYRIRTVTTAIQAADQYSAPQYLVKEWLYQ